MTLRPPPGAPVTMTETEQSVTPLELFFDLVFVYSITQVTALMATDISAADWRRGSWCSGWSGGRGSGTLVGNVHATRG